MAIGYAAMCIQFNIFRFFKHKMNPLQTLWQGASYQDHLLQSYRKSHLIVQSVLVAIGTLLAAALVIIDSEEKRIAIYVLLVVISALGTYLLLSMSRLIKARAQDVDYYHNQIIESESALPKEEQVLTAFKVYQKFSRGKVNSSSFFSEFQMTDEVRARLTEKGKGHTRKVLDRNLFIGFYILWISLHAVVIFKWIVR